MFPLLGHQQNPPPAPPLNPRQTVVFSLQRTGAGDVVFSYQFPVAASGVEVVEVIRGGGRFAQIPAVDKLDASLWAILQGAVPFEHIDPERMEAAAEMLLQGATLDAVVSAVFYTEPGGLVRLNPKRELLKRPSRSGWRRQ
jgi:hypothetical protein